MTEVAVALIGCAGLVLTTWLTTRQAVKPVKDDAAAARQSAEQAVEQTLPVSNGFAGKVLDHIVQSASEHAEQRRHNERVELLLENLTGRVVRLEENR